MRSSRVACDLYRQNVPPKKEYNNLFILEIKFKKKNVIVSCGKKNRNYSPADTRSISLGGRPIGVSSGRPDDTQLRPIYRTNEKGKSNQSRNSF